jgi:hypothetical protein
VASFGIPTDLVATLRQGNICFHLINHVGEMAMTTSLKKSNPKLENQCRYF